MAEARRGPLWDPSVHPRAQRAATVVLASSLVVALLGVGLAPLVLRHTHGEDFRAPADSPARLAGEQLERLFPLLASSLPGQIVIAVRAQEGYDTVLTEATAAWSQRLADVVVRDPRVTPFRPVIAGYYSGAMQLGLPPEDPFLHAGFVSYDNRTTALILVATKAPDWNGTYSPWAYKFWFNSFLRQFCGSPPPGTEVQVTGNFATYFEQLRGQRLEHVLMWAELRMVPVTLVVLAFIIKEVRLLVLPPVALAITLLAVATVLAPVALLVPLSSDLPPSIVSVVIALTMDYSLFMLARFTENRSMGLAIQRNVEVVLQHTGHTVTLSGLLIAMAYFGALSVPQDNLRYAGLALGVATVVAVVVNVMLMPSLLLLAGRALSGPAPRSLGDKAGRSGAGAGGAGDEVPTASTPRILAMFDSAERRVVLRKRGTWVWLMRKVEERPVSVVALIFAVFFPVLVQLPRLNASADLYMAMPMGLDSVAALRSLQRDFVVGRFDPYVVMVAGGEGPAAFTEPAGHAALLELASALWELRGVGSMVGPVWLVSESVDWQRALDLPPKVRGLYRKVVNTHLTVDGSAAALQVHTSFLPRGPSAAAWVRSVRAILSAWEQRHVGYAASLAGGGCEAVDSRAAVMGSLPRYLGAVLVGVMLVVFLMFGSLVLPFRLALAIVFTLAATFGFMVLVYQTPLLHGILPWLSNYDGLCYEVIPMASCVAVALGIDYDIFLISRIVEFRMLGLSDSTSIIQGVARTGNIISGAGVIMSVAFSGLFFSDRLMHHQVALTLIVSVLLDTFVVRTLLVPALMFVAKSRNWWPRPMPDCDEAPEELLVDFELTPGLRRSRSRLAFSSDGGGSSS